MYGVEHSFPFGCYLIHQVSQNTKQYDLIFEYFKSFILIFFNKINTCFAAIWQDVSFYA